MVRARARARWRERIRAWLAWTPLRPIASHSIPIREEVAALRLQLAAVSARYDLIELACLHEFGRASGIPARTFIRALSPKT